MLRKKLAALPLMFAVATLFLTCTPIEGDFDTVQGKAKEKNNWSVPVTGIELDKMSIELEVGEQSTITATVWPANATNKTITWYSDNELIATVVNGVVTAMGTGDAQIKASVGGIVLNCGVTVVDRDYTRMVLVPGGSFQMGKELGTAGAEDVIPVHTVTLSDFHIGKYQITQKQWIDVMGSIQDRAVPGSGRGGNFPVYFVSWYDAIVFCNRLSIIEGLQPAYYMPAHSNSTDPEVWMVNTMGGIPTGPDPDWNAVRMVIEASGYRLPTEAEWEYAAKGGNGTPDNYTYSGSDDPELVAWYDGNSSNTTHEVGIKTPNGLGIFDMSGNVREWCWDWHWEYPELEQINPTGEPLGIDRVFRGGSHSDTTTLPDFLRSVNRSWNNPYTRTSYIGFRLVKTGDPSKTLISIEVTAEPVKTFYYIGDALDLTGLEVTATFNDSSTAVITGSVGIYGFDSASEGEKSILIYYDGFDQYLTVTVLHPPVIEGMVYVPGGGFQMGKDLGNAATGDVTPVHTVMLSGFYMSIHPVTQEQWMDIIDEDRFEPAYGRGDDYPAYNVSWYDAIVLCNRLSLQDGLYPAYYLSGSNHPDIWIGSTGSSIPTSSNAIWDAVEILPDSNGYRLPTEAEWEYAAKGGNNTPGFTYSGSDDPGLVAWYEGNSPDTTHEVGIKTPNDLGIFDMSGNVWEWCFDWKDDYTSEAQTNPIGASSGTNRVIRGGCFRNPAPNLRSVDRGGNLPGDRSHNTGFRLVRPAM